MHVCTHAKTLTSLRMPAHTGAAGPSSVGPSQAREAVARLEAAQDAASISTALQLVSELGLRDQGPHELVASGAIAAVLVRLGAYREDVAVQRFGCHALRNICIGTDAAGLQRKQAAADAGALAAVVAAMAAHAGDRDVQWAGRTVLRDICFACPERTQAALIAGARAEWLQW